MKDDLLSFLLIIASLWVMAWVNARDDECFTDSCVFAMCAAEKGRPCTDEEVFGPSEHDDGPCEELPADHPDYCE